MLLLKTGPGHHPDVPTVPGVLLRPGLVPVAPDAAGLPGNRGRLGIPRHGCVAFEGEPPFLPLGL